MKFIFSGAFGELSTVRDGAHNGIDIAMQSGTTLRSISDGVIFAIRDYGDKNIGKGVIIKTDDGNFHIYGHMSKMVKFEKGQEIAAGDVIGLSGNSGHSTGPHLHFGIQSGETGEFLDPTPYYETLKAISGDVAPLQIMTALEPGGGFGGWALEQYNDFSDWIIGKEIEFILKPIALAITELSITVWDWFIYNLPDIMGYTTILSGIIIILGAMIGRGGMIRPLSIWAALMILSLCILGGV